MKKMQNGKKQLSNIKQSYNFMKMADKIAGPFSPKEFCHMTFF